MRAADRAGRGSHAADDSHFTVPAAGAAAGGGDLQLRGRELAGRRVGGDDHPGAGDQGRGGKAHISSASSNDGTSEITITFQTGYDLDVAAIDVQNSVATAQGRLPATVNATGISITKANSNFVLAAGFVSPDHSLSPAFISDYLDVYVADALKRVPGVGAVIIFGERKYAMRIWLDPNKLAARGLTPLDVTNALQEIGRAS